MTKYDSLVYKPSAKRAVYFSTLASLHAAKSGQRHSNMAANRARYTDRSYKRRVIYRRELSRGQHKWPRFYCFTCQIKQRCAW